jgi:signal transduction histidine kinase
MSIGKRLLALLAGGFAVGAGVAAAAVVIEVSDTGPGIPPEELALVFDRLYRGHAARTGGPIGAGLGLAIAASLTRAMGGDISARSEVGRGATFTVRLPLPASHRQAVAVP